MKSVDLIAAARAAEASGKIEKAAQLCSQVLYSDPSCVEALVFIGGMAARQGRVGDAEVFLKRAARLDPSNYDAVRWLATLLVGKDGGAEAAEFGRTAVRLKPRDVEAHVALGMAALGHGESELAIESFRKATELSPEMSGAYHNLGVALQRDELFEDAIEAFRKAIELAPEVGETYLHLGRTYVSDKRGDEAVETAKKAVELLPTSGLARRLLIDALMVAVHGENGEVLIREAMSNRPDSNIPHNLLASRLQEQGEFVGSEKSALRSIELEPVQGHGYYLFAQTRKMCDEDRSVMDKMESVVRQGGLEDAEIRFIHFALGKAYDDLGEFEAAMRNFDLAHAELSTPLKRRAAASTPDIASRVQRFNETVSPEFLDRFRGVGLESDQPIFIFGMPRSGTTLLEQIVSRHSTVGAGGEQFFWRDNVRRVVNISKGELDVQKLRHTAERYLVQAQALAPGRSRVTDKFLSNYLYLGILKLAFPNATFIHARRNPIDTCLSIYMRPFFAIHGYENSREDIVHTYKRYLDSMAYWREVLAPGSFLEVDYEELVQNPEEMTGKVISHCKLDWEDACLRPEEGDNRVRTFSKWQVRQPVYTTSMERWRRYEPWLGMFRDLMPAD